MQRIDVRHDGDPYDMTTLRVTERHCRSREPEVRQTGDSDRLGRTQTSVEVQIRPDYYTRCRPLRYSNPRDPDSPPQSKEGRTLGGCPGVRLTIYEH